MAVTRLGFCGPSKAYPGFAPKAPDTPPAVTDTGGLSGISGLSGIIVLDEEIGEG